MKNDGHRGDSWVQIQKMEKGELEKGEMETFKDILSQCKVQQLLPVLTHGFNNFGRKDGSRSRRISYFGFAAYDYTSLRIRSRKNQRIVDFIKAQI